MQSKLRNRQLAGLSFSTKATVWTFLRKDPGWEADIPDDYLSAAKRHRADAELLAADGRFDNAGHLIGFAAECAIKKKLRDLDRQPTACYDGHHPKPQTQLRASMNKMRLGGPWLALANGPKLFADWSVDGRYASDNTVTKAQYDAWKVATDKLFVLAKIR